MGLPWKAFLASSGGVAVLATLQKAHWSTSLVVSLFTKTYLAQLAGWVVYSLLLYPHFLSPLIGLPEPRGSHWLMGEFSRIMRDPTGIPMMDWASNIPNDGLIRYRALGNQERLLITSAEGLSEVLVKKNYDFSKPSAFRRTTARILGIGILLAEGDEHKRQRKHLMPAFAFRHVKDLYPLFWAKSKEVVHAMVDQISADASRESAGEKPAAEPAAVVQVGNWASRATLDIIGAAGLGRDFGAIRDPTNILNEAYRELSTPTRQSQILGVLTLFLPSWLTANIPVKHNRVVAKASRTVRGVCADLVREKREKLARGELHDLDILSVAIESGGFSDDDLVNQMMTFLAAGHETTAAAMQWAIYLLCLHPGVQERLRREVRERLPSVESAESIASLDIDRMPYLNAVCNEVLRYYSPVPMTLRQAAVDTSILGHRVPRGTVIVLCPWSVNRSHALWGEDANRFDPERWLPKKDGEEAAAGGKASSLGGATSNYAFLTFLHGPRSCIGQGFAKAEFACLLAAWVGRFEFGLKNKEEYDEKNLVIKGGITAKPSNGLWAVTKVLEGW
ncbi:related to isotrichodermin C-15 hydroxylase (cytochrome P-450 monooxygenase CYP65A1) [Cephalotrichum gorgonifer]|uniref:Related to isotrichodermin C-15 hydroxylase (Cytochrome P-450 monooxygenase CYP65A1) n=1 Tax=Cephalotrichum gorgonifer TaxID=2041049 RepID=A0AAE8MXE1_9PEZI|nr:related to isotrichodermin C-15 hydroxylase (cytochrome P-450 monooxygenase CYP65A1) [Cephalotrichum gorgonifer]